LIYLEVGNH